MRLRRRPANARQGVVTTLRFVICAALLAGACASESILGTRVPPHPKLDRIWAQYSGLAPKRALAIAGDPNRDWVGAAAGGADAQAEASERALEECGRERLERRMLAPCLLYAAGDDILWLSR